VDTDPRTCFWGGQKPAVEHIRLRMVSPDQQEKGGGKTAVLVPSISRRWRWEPENGERAEGRKAHTSCECIMGPFAEGGWCIT